MTITRSPIYYNYLNKNTEDPISFLQNNMFFPRLTWRILDSFVAFFRIIFYF